MEKFDGFLIPSFQHEASDLEMNANQNDFFHRLTTQLIDGG